MRNFLILCAALASTSLLANDVVRTGKVSAVDPNTNQKKEIQIFNRVNVNNEYNVMRFFFTYTCDYGAKYDKEMAQWGKTLPRNFKYVRVPVVTQEPHSIVGTFAFYAAQQTDKSKLDLFQHHAFNLIQNKGKSPSDQWTYLDAAKLAGMNTKLFQNNWGTERTKKLVKNAVILGAKYKISQTPTLTVGGIYSINPEPLAESNTSFVEFANAIASKFIAENGMAIK
ncbi:hypothetical protein HLH17_16435 [Acinetobacter sp. ANC 5380]|uniref:Thiol:disulfide interchange protein n=1 Tax=Acinetobacter terrae TaxID=2731247 RepID=A0A7Y2WCA4_9GAMM|nr:hypothetical protein [Acinetobacter terrae]NNH79206.1 hypothetical protein [Acinetobacter terrae]